MSLLFIKEKIFRLDFLLLLTARFNIYIQSLVKTFQVNYFLYGMENSIPVQIQFPTEPSGNSVSKLSGNGYIVIPLLINKQEYTFVSILTNLSPVMKVIVIVINSTITSNP